MTDCYRILGVSRHASPAEIRAAFLAKMKELHPDARRDGSAGGGEAGEISFAYWQLRDAHRRAEHDRLLFGEPRSRPRVRRRAPRTASRSKTRVQRARATAAARPCRRRSRIGRRLQPLRTAVGVSVCVLTVVGFALALTYIEPQPSLGARAATAIDAPKPMRDAARPSRRSIDPAVAEAAAGEFRAIVRRSGIDGAHLYARQCLVELAARPTMTMLDFCLAFDDEGAAWERARAGPSRALFHFAEEQRFGRYSSAVRGLAPGAVREAMLADISFFRGDS